MKHAQRILSIAFALVLALGLALPAAAAEASLAAPAYTEIDDDPGDDDENKTEAPEDSIWQILFWLGFSIVSMPLVLYGILLLPVSWVGGLFGWFMNAILFYPIVLLFMVLIDLFKYIFGAG